MNRIYCFGPLGSPELLEVIRSYPRPPLQYLEAILLVKRVPADLVKFVECLTSFP